MAKYRKKPVVEIGVKDTRQFVKKQKPWPDNIRFEERFEEGPYQQWAGYVKYFYVLTPSGKKISIYDGDWIITFEDETIGICKPNIFEATYEKVEE